MAMEPLATKGNFFHIYDFRVKPGTGEKFIQLFNEFDYSDINPMHKSPAQVKDGVLCRDIDDADHFYLIGEWRDVEIHKDIRKEMIEMAPEFVNLVDSGPFVPKYAEIVTSTPQDILDKAQRTAEI
jgi:quinol monooxygenase YgiN